MRLVEITDKNKLNNFVGAQPYAEFLQSWEWGEFQEKAEGKVVRFGLEEAGELIASATLVKKTIPAGLNYFYCPRGPILNYELPCLSAGRRITNYELLNFFFDEIKKVAEKEKAIFLRFEPKIYEIRNTKYEIRKTIDIQPSQTILLDLTKSEEEMLVAMHQKTRYNIRLAEKKEVKIEEKGRGLFENFWQMMDKTSQRDKFTAHDKGYYEKLLQAAPEIFKLFVATYQEKIIAAGIFSFFGGTATYLFGASSDEDRNVMAPYLLQWELIKRAKAAGCKYYDFFGIDEKKWPGVTRFKRGFLPAGQAGTGQEVSYPGTFDVIFAKNKYSAYKIFRKIRRLF